LLIKVVGSGMGEKAEGEREKVGELGLIAFVNWVVICAMVRRG
jgi:hypothetical protein